ncbi:unnamed protein product [Protopolystoma xenopodis]|uniref:PCAF N-terminal domain-containing protein n=1 Tax=Protopolystoma xenopodis TaxID=117903 RepID=A0A3S5CVD4_9PLAT|nr:unnamed protein product [Protopolystoma xenopodis]
MTKRILGFSYIMDRRFSLFLSRKSVRALTPEQRLSRVLPYLPCEIEGCKCASWKSDDTDSYDIKNFQCRNCRHQHFDLSSCYFDDWMSFKAVNLVEDLESLYSMCFAEKDIDTRQLYFCLFKKVNKALFIKGKPQVEDSPPFERPCINTAIRNVLLHKFCQNPKHTKFYLEIGRLIIAFINIWKLEYPKNSKKRYENETGYKLIYMRSVNFVIN